MIDNPFAIALSQRLSIDKAKCEQFGTLIQGFLGVKTGEHCKIIPFMFHDKESLAAVEQVVSEILKDKTQTLEGVSFVQHYIHYTTQQL